jgi:hypothetical protein
VRVRRPVAGPWQIAATVLYAHIVLLAAVMYQAGFGWIPGVGTHFVNKSERSAAINGLQGVSSAGYDGEFAYFIALDPIHARYYMDDPEYRYGRILYPVTARVVALGQPGAIPYALLLVNLLAVVATVFLLARYLVSRGYSAWWASVYGFFPGTIWCVLRDLTEPLAFFLVTLAFVTFANRPERILRYAPTFALAALTRETTIVFPAFVAFDFVLRRRDGGLPSRTSFIRAAQLLLISIAPLALYRFALNLWIDSWSRRAPLALIPFHGLVQGHLDARRVVVIFAVVIPGLAWLAIAATATMSGQRALPLAFVIANAVWFIILLPDVAYPEYSSAGRAMIGLVLAAVLSIPLLRASPRPHPRLVLIGFALLTPCWFLAALMVASFVRF